MPYSIYNSGKSIIREKRMSSFRCLREDEAKNDVLCSKGCSNMDSSFYNENYERLGRKVEGKVERREGKAYTERVHSINNSVHV